MSYRNLNQYRVTKLVAMLSLLTVAFALTACVEPRDEQVPTGEDAPPAQEAPVAPTGESTPSPGQPVPQNPDPLAVPPNQPASPTGDPEMPVPTMVDPGPMQPLEPNAVPPSKITMVDGPENKIAEYDNDYFYSGSGFEDSIVARALAEMNEDDLAFAKTLRNPILELNISSRLVKFKIDRRETVTKHERNVVTKKVQASQVQFVSTPDSKGRVYARDDKAKLKFRIQCLDKAQSCRVAMVRVVDFSRSKNRKAFILVHLVKARLSQKGESRVISESPTGYDYWTNTLKRSEDPKNLRQDQTIANPELYTAAIIGVRSEFILSFYSYALVGKVVRERVTAISGRLLKMYGTSEMNLPLDKKKFIYIFDKERRSADSELLRQVEQVHMVKNDGRGGLDFELLTAGGLGLQSVRLMVEPTRPELGELPAPGAD